MKCIFFVITAFLAEAWMKPLSNLPPRRHVFLALLLLIFLLLGRRIKRRGNFYLLGICQTHGQCISLNGEFHRVAKGCILLQCHLGSGNHAHVEEVLTECSFATHLEDGDRLPFAKFSQCHNCYALCSCSAKVRKKDEVQGETGLLQSKTPKNDEVRKVFPRTGKSGYT